LEQRKGRIQRIGQVRDEALLYNMRCRGSVEDRVHELVSARLTAISTLFGQIPDTLEDVWGAIALNDERRAQQIIDPMPPPSVVPRALRGGRGNRSKFGAGKRRGNCPSVASSVHGLAQPWKPPSSGSVSRVSIRLVRAMHICARPAKWVCQPRMVRVCCLMWTESWGPADIPGDVGAVRGGAGCAAVIGADAEGLEVVHRVDAEAETQPAISHLLSVTRMGRVDLSGDSDRSRKVGARRAN
jgi:hypothetical protein